MLRSYLSTLIVVLCFSHSMASANNASSQCYEEVCKDGVLVGKTCYWLPYRAGPPVNYTEAAKLCNFHGGVLAEIPTEESYHAVFNYVKRSWYRTHSTMIQVWLNSVYSPNIGVFLVGGGTSYVNWFPGYPTSSLTTHVQMALEVPTSPNHRLDHHGMFNIIGSHFAAPLCQFRL